MRRYLTVRWIVAHVVLLAILVTFVQLGLWQLRRLDDRRAFNATLTARAALPPVDATTLRGADASSTAYRRVRATGRFDASNEFILLNRSRNSIAGHHVVTPLVLADGSAILVERGWVPFALDEPPVGEAPPAPGTVSVTGVLFPSVERGRFGPQDAGAAKRVFRIDTALMAGSLPYPIAALWMLPDVGEEALAGGLPRPVEPPPLDEGPHRSYALQWFGFALAATGVYTAFIRTDARRRSRAPLSG